MHLQTQATQRAFELNHSAEDLQAFARIGDPESLAAELAAAPRGGWSPIKIEDQADTSATRVH